MEEPAQFHQTTERLGTDPLSKLLLRLSLPSIVSMVAISIYNLVDTFWVAKLGYQSIAALTAVMPAWIICIAVGAGTGVGANALAARRFGERNTESANQVAAQTPLLSFGMGMLFMLAMNLFPYQICRLAGAPPDVIDLSVQYFVILSWAMPFLFLGLIGRNVFQAAGDAVRPMIVTIFGQVCNVILDPFFIFGWGFFPEMGVAGAAMATFISNAMSVGLGIFYIASNRTPYRIKLHHFIPRWGVIHDIYRVGLPSMVMETTESIIFALFNHLVAGFGSIALAAVGIAGRLSDLLFMPVVGTSHGLLPIVGYSLGAKLWKRLWGVVKLASIWTAIMMAAVTIFIEIFAPQMVRLFSKNPDLINIAVPGMRIFLSSMVVIGPTIMFITTFQGLSKGKDAMVLSLARQFIFFVPGLYVLSHFMGLNGVWLSMPVSDVLGFIVSGLWLYREYLVQKKSGLWLETSELNKTLYNAEVR
jgi:putative MATE family efflux protein